MFVILEINYTSFGSSIFLSLLILSSFTSSLDFSLYFSSLLIISLFSFSISFASLLSSLISFTSSLSFLLSISFTSLSILPSLPSISPGTSLITIPSLTLLLYSSSSNSSISSLEDSLRSSRGLSSINLFCLFINSYNYFY